MLSILLCSSGTELGREKREAGITCVFVLTGRSNTGQGSDVFEQPAGISYRRGK